MDGAVAGAEQNEAVFWSDVSFRGYVVEGGGGGGGTVLGESKRGRPLNSSVDLNEGRMDVGMSEHMEMDGKEKMWNIEGNCQREGDWIGAGSGRSVVGREKSTAESEGGIAAESGGPDSKALSVSDGQRKGKAPPPQAEQPRSTLEATEQLPEATALLASGGRGAANVAAASRTSVSLPPPASLILDPGRPLANDPMAELSPREEEGEGEGGLQQSAEGIGVRESQSIASNSSGGSRRSSRRLAEDEWVEQPEPGVYITLAKLAQGGNELRRVRFR